MSDDVRFEIPEEMRAMAEASFEHMRGQRQRYQRQGDLPNVMRSKH